MGQRFREVALNLNGRADHLDRMGRPGVAADLVDHEFVLPPKAETRLPSWGWITGHIGDPIVVRDAVQAALAVGVLSEFDVAGRETLCALLPANENWPVPLWLVTHVDLHRTEKV